MPTTIETRASQGYGFLEWFVMLLICFVIIQGLLILAHKICKSSVVLIGSLSGFIVDSAITIYS